MSACRSAVSQHLVEPATSSFEQIEVSRGASSAWRVTLTVKAKGPDGQLQAARVHCDLSDAFEVVDLGD